MVSVRVMGVAIDVAVAAAVIGVEVAASGTGVTVTGVAAAVDIGVARVIDVGFTGLAAADVATRVGATVGVWFGVSVILNGVGDISILILTGIGSKCWVNSRISSCIVVVVLDVIGGITFFNLIINKCLLFF